MPLSATLNGLDLFAFPAALFGLPGLAAGFFPSVAPALPPDVVPPPLALPVAPGLPVAVVLPPGALLVAPELNLVDAVFRDLLLGVAPVIPAVPPSLPGFSFPAVPPSPPGFSLPGFAVDCSCGAESPEISIECVRQAPARFLGAPAAGKIRDATLRGSNPRARRSNIQQLLGEKRHRSSLRAVLRLLAGRATLLAGSRAGAVAGGLVGGAERTGLESVAGATEPTRSSRGGQLKRPEYRKKAASAANRTKAIQIILRCFKLPSLFAFNLVLTNLVPASDSEFSLVGCGVL